MSCHAEYPHLIDLQRRYGGKNFQVVSIVLVSPDEASIRSFLGPMKPTFPIVRVADAVPEAYHVYGIPANFLVGPDGVIQRRFEGYTPSEWKTQLLPLVQKAARA